jgi:hypothetical protein
MGNPFGPKGFALVRRDLQGVRAGKSRRRSSQIIIHEADEPDPLVGLFDADGLASEHQAEIDLLPMEADALPNGEGGSPVVEGIFDVRQTSIGPLRRAVSLRRTLHVECLVWPLFVVAFEEVVELGLLLQEVFGGQLGGLQLQRFPVQLHTGSLET